MKYSTLLLAGFSLFGLIAGYTGTASAQFSQVEPYVEEAKPVKTVENYQPEMVRAMTLHDIQFQINYLTKSLLNSLQDAQEKYDLSAAQNKALKDCSIHALSKVYTNPAEAYASIQNAYNEKVKLLTVYINETGDSASTENAESFPYWRVGREVLFDVYKSPEKYGNTKSKFPLWTDQKYLYTQKVNNILTGIHKKFVLPEIVGETVNLKNKAFNEGLSNHLNAFAQQNGILNSLDYAENTKKYNELLNYLKGHPQYSSLKTGISSALPPLPDPIPPYYEIIQLTENPAETGSIFPEWPAPWAEYIQRGLDKRASGGEMDTCFMPNSITLRPKYQTLGGADINNRLSLTKEKEEELDSYKNTLESVQEIIDTRVSSINKSLTEAGIHQQLDLKANNTDEILNLLKTAKKEAIKKARELYKQQTKTANSNNPSLENALDSLKGMDPGSEEYKQMVDNLNAAQNASDEKFLNDLETDIDGLAMQGNLATNDAIQNIESQEATYALQEKIAAQDRQNRDAQWEKIIDMNTCINLGVNTPKP